MEILKLPKNGINIKGKRVTLSIDPSGKIDTNAVLLLNKNIHDVDHESDAVVISGPGEYEISGVNITTSSGINSLIYSINIDGIDLLIGDSKSLESLHAKLKEHNLVLVDCREEIDAAAITPLVSNAVICFGEKAEHTAAAFGKDEIQKVSKYQAKAEKLPTEVETVILI